MEKKKEYKLKYTDKQLESFREELEERLGNSVFLKIQKYYYRECFYKLLEMKGGKTYYKPERFDEEIAQRCGLTAIISTDHDTEETLTFFTSSGGGIDLKVRLETYQAIMSGTISECNMLEEREDDFKAVMGEEMIEEVKKRLARNYTVNFHFQNYEEG